MKKFIVSYCILNSFPFKALNGIHLFYLTKFVHCQSSSKKKIKKSKKINKKSKNQNLLFIFTQIISHKHSMPSCCLPPQITLALFAYLLGSIVILLVFTMFLSFTLLNWDLHTPNSFPFIISFLDVFMMSWITFRFYKLYRNETSNEKDCSFQFEGIDGLLFAIQTGLSVLFFFFFSPP